jgi:hypothetical protein
MLSKKDPHYGALLIEEAKLHLGTVMAGQDSEPFFSAMLQIVEDRIYLKYTTLRNQEVELKGIKDFLQSVYYGLGIKDMETFLCNVVKSSLKERSRNKYAHRFIEWLKEQDPSFQFPSSYFEFRRVMRMIYYNRQMPKAKKGLAYKTARFLYNQDPEILQHIGYGRKYLTVESCYYGEGYEEKRKALKPIKLYQNPTLHQLEEVAEALFRRFGHFKAERLAAMLGERCELSKALKQSQEDEQLADSN